MSPLLTLIAMGLGHFVADWMLQTHYQAINKSKNWRVRLEHCTEYGIVMWFCLIAFAGLNTSILVHLAILGYIILTHFLVDDYKLVYLIRKRSGDPSAQSEKEFVESFNTPRGFVVNVVTDQILHMISLLLLFGVLC